MQFNSSLNPVLLLLLATFFILPAPLLAQDFQVVHNFTGGVDGGHPQAGVMFDAAENMYTATTGGGSHDANCQSFGCGVVLRLTRVGVNWTASPFYTFQGGSDGSLPDAGLAVGPSGTLYGTTSAGGYDNNGFGFGTVFSLMPDMHACVAAPCPWTETVLYRFAAGNDGWQPTLGKLVLDAAGNLYGTTVNGGSASCGGYGCGTVFKLTPVSGGWAESVLYTFVGDSGGAYPQGGLVFDQAGNLYGTATGGGMSCDVYADGCGVVFKLSPAQDGWTETVLHSFTGGADGATPVGGVIFGAPGVLYGTTELGGSGNGTVFQLTASGSSWTLNTIYAFRGPGVAGPTANLTLDASGNLLGTTLSGPPDYPFPPCEGSVFKLTQARGTWGYTLLHCFTGDSDGGQPYSPVALDSHGNLFGTTFAGGAYGQGVVWELAP